MIFASAFDRILPEGVAKVTSGGVPVVALLLMVIPSIIVSAFYAYQPTFVQLTYDATLVIAVMFLGSGLAFMIMPWRAKSIWENSALPKAKILGVPWMAIVAAAYSAFMVFNLYLWIYDPTNAYGVGYKNKQLDDLHGHPVRRRDRHLDRRLGGAQASGHGPRGGRQGDPGRVTFTSVESQSRSA